jgi:hypothetical protein
MRKLSSARKARSGATEARDNGGVPNVPPADAEGSSAAGGAPEVEAGGWYEAGHWWPTELEVPAQDRPTTPDVAAAAVHPERREVRTGGVNLPIPGLKTASELNSREHWRTKHARHAQQKNVVTLALRGTIASTMMVFAPLVVTITRSSPRKTTRIIDGRTVDVPDSDNLISSQKYVRDAIARVLGVDDGDPRVEWRVEREKGQWGIRIKIEPKT